MSIRNKQRNKIILSKIKITLRYLFLTVTLNSQLSTYLPKTVFNVLGDYFENFQ